MLSGAGRVFSPFLPNFEWFGADKLLCTFEFLSKFKFRREFECDLYSYLLFLLTITKVLV